MRKLDVYQFLVPESTHRYLSVEDEGSQTFNEETEEKKRKAHGFILKMRKITDILRSTASAPPGSVAVTPTIIV